MDAIKNYLAPYGLKDALKALVDGDVTILCGGTDAQKALLRIWWCDEHDTRGRSPGRKRQRSAPHQISDPCVAQGQQVFDKIIVIVNL